MHNTPFPSIMRLRRGRTKICNLETVSQTANLTNDTKPLKIMVANGVLVKTKIFTWEKIEPISTTIRISEN
jgi:hypothetical protein